MCKNLYDSVFSTCCMLVMDQHAAPVQSMLVMFQHAVPEQRINRPCCCVFSLSRAAGLNRRPGMLHHRTGFPVLGLTGLRLN